ncbi:MAG: SDR family NAD(P)-dependent oxidoreductase [Gammaproteobacteria bacterium]|nr:SDR family NAD(P)-dependent oxidoreductase [Gammaproteobacteria bacterium]NVK87036.1 SDR family NAD(P)-dependent oxidoreductase [Gammaproteobacteria bacterium]
MACNPTAIITGASRGLGAEIARALAAENFDLVLIAREQTGLENLAAELCESFSINAQILVLDLNQCEQISVAMKSLLATLTNVDLLVNNAGIGFYKPLDEHSDQELMALVNINLLAPMILTREVVSKMKSQSAGHIVNIGSDLAQRPLANMAPYVASKYGIQGFTESLVREVKTHGIRLTQINTGMMATDFHSEPVELNDAALDPKQVAQLVVTVCQTPRNQIIDQITLHPIGQDY